MVRVIGLGGVWDTEIPVGETASWECSQPIDNTLQAFMIKVWIDSAFRIDKGNLFPVTEKDDREDFAWSWNYIYIV